MVKVGKDYEIFSVPEKIIGVDCTKDNLKIIQVKGILDNNTVSFNLPVGCIKKLIIENGEITSLNLIVSKI